MSDIVVVDGKGHLLGRLASIVAKQLLIGKKIVIVRSEAIVISGSSKKKKITSPIPLMANNYSQEKQSEVCRICPKEDEYKSQEGTFPFPLSFSHFLANGNALWTVEQLRVWLMLKTRQVRGMIPHKTVRGQIALGRLAVSFHFFAVSIFF